MTTVVRAAGYGESDQLEVVEVDDLSAPPPGSVNVAVRAAGINMYDLKSYSGVFGTDPDKLPIRLGLEAAGVITAVGDDDAPVSVGDRVVVHPVSGAYATDLQVDLDQVTPLPDSLDFAPAAGLLLTGTTAVHALEAADVASGDTVLIHGGAGGVGLMAVQIARLRGATPIATASPDQHALVEEFGGIPVAFGPGLADRVRAAAPDGVDAALDLVGVDEAFEVSLELVADRSRIATIARFSQDAFDAGVKVLGAGGDPGTELRKAARRQLVELAAEGDLKVLVSQTFPLEQAAAAHRQVSGTQNVGKVVLTV